MSLRSPVPHLPASRPLAAVLTATLAGGVLAGVVLVGGVEATAATPAALSANQRLNAGGAITAPDGRTRLTMQSDGNLVLYSPTRALWSSRTSGHPGAFFVVQGDGNMVVYDAAKVARWNSATHDVATLTVQDDGNLVGRTATGTARWTSGTAYPPASAGPWSSPDGRFSAGLQSDGNLVLRYRGSATPDVLWSSHTGGHPQAWLAAQSDGNLVIYENGHALWASGSAGRPGAKPGVSATGDFAVTSSAAGVVWHTGTAGAATGLDGRTTDHRFTPVWNHVLGGTETRVALSSPGVATLDGGGPAVVFGSRGGALNAFHVTDGSTVPGWPVQTGVAVDSTPSVSGSGASARVYVGLGTSTAHTLGGYAAYGPQGRRLWEVVPREMPSGGGTVGVMSSLAVGNLQTGTDVTSGAMGLMGYAMSSSGAVLSGFPWYEGDTNFSTPALADLTGDGRDEIVIGGDSSAGPALGRTWTNGGHIRVVRNTGYRGSTNPSLATSCDYVTNQVVQSSPAVGRILPGGAAGIVVGTGTWFAGAPDTNTVFALDTTCHVKWRATLDGAAVASPSLIDVDGNGSLEVVTASQHGNSSTVYVLDGATGRVRSTTALGGRVYGSVTSVDVAGKRTLLAGNTIGVAVIDAATGTLTGDLAPGIAVQNTVTVTLDPGNTVGVTVVGMNAQSRGVALHFRVADTTATTVSGRGQWPMFHHDPGLRGSVL